MFSLKLLVCDGELRLVGWRVEQGVGVSFGQEVDEYLLKFLFLCSLLAIESFDEILVFLQNALVLIDEVLAHFFKVFLIDFQLLNLFGDRCLDASVSAALVQLKLLLLLFLVLSADVLKQILSSCFEVLVHINIFPLRMAYFFEPIHIQLANKRSKVPMLEVLRQNFLRELCDIFNWKGIIVGSPINGFRVVFILSKIGITSIIS